MNTRALLLAALAAVPMTMAHAQTPAAAVPQLPPGQSLSEGVGIDAAGQHALRQRFVGK